MLGAAPKGAKMATGKDSVKESLTLIRGIPPDKPIYDDTGAVDDIIMSDGRKITVKSVKDKNIKPRQARIRNTTGEVETIDMGGGIKMDGKRQGRSFIMSITEGTLANVMIFGSAIVGIILLVALYRIYKQANHKERIRATVILGCCFVLSIGLFIGIKSSDLPSRLFPSYSQGVESQEKGQDILEKYLNKKNSKRNKEHKKPETVSRSEIKRKLQRIRFIMENGEIPEGKQL